MLAYLKKTRVWWKVFCLRVSQAMKEAKMQRSQAKKAGNPPAAAGGMPGQPAALTNLNMPADAQKNQGYYESLMEAINTILKCPKFSDIRVAEPLAITDGVDASSGVQAITRRFRFRDWGEVSRTLDDGIPLADLNWLPHTPY